MRKAISLFSGSLLLFQSIAPGLAAIPQMVSSTAYAQEVTPTDTETPTPTVESSPSPTQETTATPTPEPTTELSPTVEVTPTPTGDMTPTVTPTDTQTPTPSETSTPSATPTNTASPTQTTEPPHETSPPSNQSQGEILDGISTTAPTPTLTPKPTIQPKQTVTGHIEAVIFDNISAPSLNLDSTVSPSSATLTTDKADYAPTDTVVISGTGFLPTHTYRLIITSNDPPPVTVDVSITTSTEGSFLYAYQLDGHYRPNYQVAVKDASDTTIATTTFTDSDTGFLAPSANVQNGAGDSWTNPSNAYANGGGAATETGGDRHRYYNFGISVPSGATIDGIAVMADAWSSDSTGCQLGVDLSWNAGSNWSSEKTQNLTGSETTYTLGGTTDKWGAHSWIDTDVTNANFRVRVRDIDPGSACSGDTSLDFLQAKVYYSAAVVTATPTPTVTATPTSTPVATATPTPTPALSGPIAVQNIACMADQPSAPSGLNCTANDIDIASVDNIHIVESSADGVNFSATSATECEYPGQYIKFTASWHVLSNASERYNIGLWFANSGQTSALHGSCSASTLPTSPSPFFEGSGDICGDINSSGTGTVSPAITVVARCVAAPGTNQLSLPYCTSWDNNTQTAACTDPAGTVPGTPSKCSCNDGFTIPIVVPPAIEVIKNISPTNDPGLFNLQVNSSTKKANATHLDTTGKIGVTAGSNTFGETAGSGTDLTNYTASASCVLRGTQTTVGTSQNANTWTIASVANGQDIVCTITNTRINNGSITVIKDASPNNSQDFAFTTTGTGLSSFNLDDDADNTLSNTKVFSSLSSGAYSITESATSGWSLSSLSCVDNTTQSAVGTINGAEASLSLASGQHVTCTYTNTQDTGTITVNKLVDTDGDGTFETSNPNTVTWSLDGSGTYSMGSSVSGVTTGSHSVNESTLSDYHFVGWYLTADTSKTCANTPNKTLPASVSVVTSQTTEITLCNAHDTGTLRVLKNVDLNGDGDYTDANEIGATDWNWQANGGSNHTTGDSALTVPTGSYALTETDKTDFHFVNLQCTGGTLTNNSVSVITGANVVCTFTNARDTGTIKIVKDVSPDDTGATGWDFAISGGTPNTASNLHDGDGSSVYTSMTGSYTVAETAHTGTTLANYTTTYSCTVGQTVLASGNGTTTDSFTLAANKNVICTFTNSIKRGAIIVEKQMVGGTGTASFTGDVAGAISTNGGEIQTANVLPGTYSSVESAMSGWDLTALTCDDTNSTGSIQTRTATFVVEPGETVMCTFTNTKRGHLTVYKVTDPQSDTTAAFDITATGSGTISGLAQRTIAGGGSQDYEVTPGAYWITESTNAGWAKTGDTCQNVSIAAGESKSCTITNTKLGNITVIKYHDKNASGVKDDGEGTLDEWEIHLSAMSQFTGAQVAGQVTFIDLLPATYTLSEQLKTNWFQSNIACDQETGTDADNSHSVTVAAGQHITCYIGNYQNGSVTVTKRVVNPDGGAVTDTSVRFPFAVGGSTDAVSLTDDESHTYSVAPGLHTVEETTNENYDFDGCTGGVAGDTFAGTTVTVVSGQETTVECTNKQKKAEITVVKDVTKYDGSAVSDSHTFGVTLNGELTSFAERSNAVFSVNPGEYGATESADTDYTLVSNDGPKTVASNGKATITIVNKQNPGTISGFKFKADGITGIQNWLISLYSCASDFTGCVLGDSTNTDENGFYSFTNLVTGFYKVMEELVSGYTPMTATEHSVEIAPATESTGNNFSNFKNISITACKVKDADANLNTLDDQSAVSGWTMNLIVDDETQEPSITTGRDGCYTWTDLGPNHSYGVSEESQTGWSALGATSHSFGQAVDGDELQHTFYNTQLGSIHGVKWHDVNGNGVQDEIGQELSGWTINLYKYVDESYELADSKVTDAGTEHFGWYWFEDLYPGQYKVCETQQSGWTQTYPTGDGCYMITLPDGNSGGFPVETNATTGPVYNFGNQQHGSIRVYKYADLNENGVKDEDEAYLSDWQMNISGEELSTTQTTNGNGYTDFADLIPSTYTLSETIKSGWTQTAITCTSDEQVQRDDQLTLVSKVHAQEAPNNHLVTVGAGQSVTCEVGNHYTLPKLRIEKTNNAAGDKTPGSDVQFTLTITAEDNDVLGVSVKDLPSKGFTYRAGSWSAKKNGNPFAVGEPTYHSPGTWFLGDMALGDVVELVYTADISGDQQSGTYRDLAWAAGTNLLSDEVVANDVTGVFVGTDVTVVRTNDTSTGVNVVTEKTGEVLGASTELPSTGATLLWLELSALGFTLGILSMLFGVSIQKKSKKGKRTTHV